MNLIHLGIKMVKKIKNLLLSKKMRLLINNNNKQEH